jgi:hypothetical protein
LLKVSGNSNVPSPTSSRRIPRIPLIVTGAGLAIALLGVLIFVGVKPSHKGAAPQPTTQPPPPPTSFAIPGCYNLSVPPVELPNKLNIVGCASVAVALQDMSWSLWGPGGADGTGTAVFKICDPNCAAGYQLMNPVRVHAWNPQPPRADALCQVGLKIFADMILAFPKGAPPPTAEKMNTQYNGLPAVHYVNYPVDNSLDKEFIGYTFCN